MTAEYYSRNAVCLKWQVAEGYGHCQLVDPEQSGNSKGKPSQIKTAVVGFVQLTHTILYSQD